jgi:ABC-type transporter Mla MlaB component
MRQTAVDLDVSWLVPADLDAVDALARLQVAAARRGRHLQLHGCAGGLSELITFVGLSDVVRPCPCCSRHFSEEVSGEMARRGGVLRELT